MTIELSLRRRASKARSLAILWLLLLATILVGTSVSLPSVAGKLLNSVNTTIGARPKTESTGTQNNQQNAGPAITPQVFTLTILALSVFTVSFGCYFLSRTALIELESAARLTGLADALCMAGDDWGQFEKAANLLVPKPGELTDPKIFSANDLKLLADTLKQLK